MKLFRNLDAVREATAKGVCLSVGVFDGAHRGHQMLIENTCWRAKDLGLKAMVFTFNQHPLSLLAPPYAPLLLTCPAEKARLIEHYGADLCLMLDFTVEFSQIQAMNFLEEIIHDICHARYLTCGRDFRFGAQGTGDASMLKVMGVKLGFEVDVCDSLLHEGIPIKSTRVRQSLLDGHVEEANALLGRPYKLHGEVVKGDGRGRQLGFPTANIEPPPERLVPGDGVYAAQVVVGGMVYPSMMNIGLRPTFDGAKRSLEAHLFDFIGDLYGETVEVRFVTLMRKEQKFDSLESLIKQLRIDELVCREILTQQAEGTY